MFLWLGFFSELGLAKERRETPHLSDLQILVEARMESKRLLAGSSTAAIDWVTGSPQV